MPRAGGGLNLPIADDRYLNESLNLSDLDNVATARTNLGLVAGGAGDIWVEKAGDTMTGNLNMGGNTLFGNTTAGGSLTLSSTTNATKGDINLGESFKIGPDGSGVGNTSFGVLTWARGTRLYEQGGGSDPERFFFLSNGDRYEVLSEDGGAFLFSANGANSANPDRFISYKGICSGSYATTAPPSNGMILSGDVGIGTNAPANRFHVVGASNTFFYFQGNSNFGSMLLRAGTTVRGYFGYSNTSGYITNSINQGIHLRGENGISFGKGATKVFDVTGNAILWIGSDAEAASGARMHFQAGTTTLAPIRLNAGTNLTTPLAGALEFTTDDLWFTTTTSTTRRNLGGYYYRAITSARTLDGSDELVDCTSGSFSVTLPTAVGFTREYTIKNTGTGVITLATTSSQTIDDQASGTITLNQYDSYTLRSDGANWIIV